LEVREAVAHDHDDRILASHHQAMRSAHAQDYFSRCPKSSWCPAET
jgi:hypothetical protein